MANGEAVLPVFDWDAILLVEVTQNPWAGRILMMLEMVTKEMIRIAVCASTVLLTISNQISFRRLLFSTF